MPIANISDGESGASVRTKLNALIDYVNSLEAMTNARFKDAGGGTRTLQVKNQDDSKFHTPIMEGDTNEPSWVIGAPGEV